MNSEQIVVNKENKTSIFEKILQDIEQKNPRHAKKLKTKLTGLEPEFYENADIFYEKYIAFVQKSGKDLGYGVDSYLRVVSDTLYEQIRFMQTGEYSCKSFEDAYNRVYNNPKVMEYYMHGLLMTQFLWHHHYSILKLFRKVLPTFKGKVKKYLEIGGGHGLYLKEAIEFLGEENEYHMVDISKSSLDMAKEFVENPAVTFMLQDIYKYEVDGYYDFVTMGEVLEHVEKPVELMKQINRLLKPEGYAWITTPANAPAIDHISLFTSRQDIVDIFNKADFEVLEDISLYTEDVTVERAIELKIPMMYGALLKKIK